MMTDPMPEPEGPEDERFVYVVTAAGVEAVRGGAVVVESEREATTMSCERRLYAAPSSARDLRRLGLRTGFVGGR